MIPKRLTYSVCATALVSVAFATGSAGANETWGPGFKSCGSFKADGYTIEVSAKKLPCKRATAIQRELWLGPVSRKTIVNGGSGAAGYIKLKRYPGWKCTSGAGAGSCRKGGSWASYEN